MDDSKVTILYTEKKEDEVPFYENKWFKLTQKILRPLINFPPVKRYISKSKSGLIGRIPKIYKEENYTKALELSVLGLSKCKRNSPFMDDFYWWGFLSYAVYCANMLKSKPIMKKLIKLSHFGFESVEGHYASYCFSRFSHFLYVEGDYDKAIEFAEKSREADNSAGEPYYLLGYYELFVNQGDPIEFFKQAIERDHSILARIVHHPSLQEFPNIIDDLKKLYPLDTSESLTRSVVVPSEDRIVGNPPNGG
jgi:hypothetical protein